MLSGCKKESYLIVNGSIDKKLGKVEGKYGKFSGEKNFSLKFLKDEVVFSMDSKNERKDEMREVVQKFAVR